MRTRTRAEKAARTRRKNGREVLALARPHQVKRDVPWMTVKRDGREILNLKTARGSTEYRERTLFMAERQGWLCGICGKWMCMADVTFEHVDKRSGGRQNDVTYAYKNARGVAVQNVAAHYACNTSLGSKRLVRSKA